MKYLGVDFETFTNIPNYSLGKRGTTLFDYVHDPHFKVHLAAIKEGDTPSFYLVDPLNTSPAWIGLTRSYTLITLNLTPIY